MTDDSAEIHLLKSRIAQLETENATLKKGLMEAPNGTVIGTTELKSLFADAEKFVADYFQQITFDPGSATIQIEDERYVLMRASSLSIDFFEKIKDLYADKGEEEAIHIGQNFLFDIAHVIGLEDAGAFHKKMNLKDPLAKLSAGPVHFAYSGWSNVEILAANPSPDDNFYLKFNHPSSFEAVTWIKNGKASKSPVCIMNSGYASGWCEESFGIPLTAVEVTCRAKGDEKCSFIMAHPSKIQSFLDQLNLESRAQVRYEIPHFFERKKVEQDVIDSLEEKSILLKEIHHRVKNNLQLISSLINLQAHHTESKVVEEIFHEIKNRIKAIALVHEKLYQSSDVEYVNVEEYLRSIMDLIEHSLASGHVISLEVDQNVNRRITIDKALPCGLILNELIANAIKYAFPDPYDKVKRINTKLKETKGKYIIQISDNGIGLPTDFELSQADSLGFEIVLSFVEQLNGRIEFTSNARSGTTFTIQFDPF